MYGLTLTPGDRRTRRRRAVGQAGPIINGTGPVLATLAGGDNLNTRVTWGSYTPTAPAVSINSPTVKEYRVNGAAGTWTTLGGGGYVVGQGEFIEIRETVTDNTGRQRVFTNSRAVPILAPVPTVLPFITGTPREGQTLTLDLGTWVGLPTINFEIQWRRSGIPTVVTGLTYVLGAGDVDETISARVIATNPGGSTPVVTASTPVIRAFGDVDPFSLTLNVNTLTFNGLGLELDGQTLRFF